MKLPSPPQGLIEDLLNDWSSEKYHNENKNGGRSDLSFLSDDKKDYSDFESGFRRFISGGVSVQRISPRELDGGRVEFLEKRILWLMLSPETESLRLGYLSKLTSESNDDRSIFSDDYTAGEYSLDEVTADSKSLTVSCFPRH